MNISQITELETKEEFLQRVFRKGKSYEAKEQARSAINNLNYFCKSKYSKTEAEILKELSKEPTQKEPTQKNEQKKTYTIEEIKKKYPNAYEPWTKSDDEILKNYWNDESNKLSRYFKIKELTEKLGRQPGGINSRLFQMELDVYRKNLEEPEVQSHQD